MATSQWKTFRSLLLPTPSRKGPKDKGEKVEAWKGGVLTHLRSAIIIPQNIGRIVHIHNGLKYIPLKISENMVGYRFGMFSSTKKRAVHKKKK